MKYLFITIFSFCFYFSGAQVSYLESFENGIFVVDYDGDKYLHTNVDNNKLELYNSDFTLNKSIDINVPTGYKLFYYNSIAAEYFSDNVFDTDSDYEFLVSFIDTDETGYYRMKAYDEHGSEIEDFGYTYSPYSAQIYSVSQELRLVVTYYPDTSSDIDYAVYSLGGNNQSINKNLRPKKLMAYPNPAERTVYISYSLNNGESAELNIFNSSGILIETKRIGSAFKKLQLDVSDYSAGTYIYKYNKVSGKFVVK